MPFDGLTLRALLHELNAQYQDARIDKIHQPEKNELALTLKRYKEPSAKLLISADAQRARLHISTDRSDNPKQAPAFCMLLRKHLEGGKIKHFEQPGLERIARIHIEALNDFREWQEKVLVCEFMGKHSNIILLNPETNTIIDGIRKYGSDLSSWREVLPGREYISPPPQNKAELTHLSYEQFCARIWADEKLALSRALFTVADGFSPRSAQELTFNSGLDPQMPVAECGELELSTLYRSLLDWLNELYSGHYLPTLMQDRPKSSDIAPWSPQSLPEAALTHFDSMNQCCDEYYRQKMDQIRTDNAKRTLSRKLEILLEKHARSLNFQQGDLHAAYGKEIYKTKGELLTAYAHEYKKGDLQAVVEDFVTGEPVTIELSPRFTPIENAQQLFKIYNKSRGAIRHLQERIADSEREIEYIESVLVAINACARYEELGEIREELEKGGYLTAPPAKKKEKITKSSPRRYLSSDGMTILVGRNNVQNDWLTLRYADRDDLWLHTQEIPGTHVILRLPSHLKSIQEVPDASVEEAALLAAWYSKAAASPKVPVDYTFRRQVSKPAAAKPGMVVYEGYWTLMVNPCSPAMQDILAREEA
ncbi:MAG: NFACT RNA binding domain-containing protein, partial [Syntrophomonadaceae bacterium]|nr:NFACT RNA binding domain-containing protein [Syntrophomonadaceae bacterium]